MVHLIKKLTFYARPTSTGMSMLHTTDGHATGTDTGIASAILSERSQSRIMIFVRQDHSECQ